MIKNLELLIYYILICFWISCSSNEAYLDSELPFEERVNDLVSRMTIEEKVSQLNNNSPEISRLKIPAYNWWNECLHGVGRAGIATVFPQAIGMASMWDDSTMFNIATSISDEARAKYNNYVKSGNRGIYHGLTFWSPNINIFRDPRWGRGMETYGEDPYLTGELAVAFVNGLQGNDPKYFKLIATAKHFVAHSGPETLRHQFNAVPSQYDFLETYSPQFKKVVQKSGVYSVMCAYNSYNGQPCCGNIDLTNLLRNDWGFKGYIVSDCGAINDFYSGEGHEIVNTEWEAAAIAVKAGTDLNCGESYSSLSEAIANGNISEKEIDVALKRLLLARMKLGMFDNENEVSYNSIPYNVVDSEKHKQLALLAARKSIVLLKNENNLLPYSKNIKKVAVIGPNANNPEILLGNYNGFPSNPKTPLQGLIEKLPGSRVEYSPGCPLAEELPLFSIVPEEVLYTDRTKSKNGLKGEYFNNTEFKGKPELVRTDKTIDFKWWTNGPGSSIPGDNFSARWSGVLIPRLSGKYAMGGDAFPEFRIWINNKMVFERKSIHHSQKQYELIQLEAGKAYDLKIEFIQSNSDYPFIQLLWQEPANLSKLRADAVKLASESDLTILCMGLSPMIEGEEMEVRVKGFTGGDRDDISLPAIQTELIKAIQKLGKPTILVLFNGSALAFNWEAKNLKAIIEAWYPGQSGGTAIADIIFGDYNPSGRLPVTFYKSVDQIPAFDNYNMEGKTYRYFKGEPLYKFGFGLSYTTFKYENLVVSKEITAGEPLEISVDVSNTGKLAGEEIVQLYLAHPESEFKVSLRALKGFKRIELKPDQSKTVNFTVLPEDMAVLNSKNDYVISNEILLLSVGGRQPDKEAMENGNVINGSVQIRVENAEYFPIK